MDISQIRREYFGKPLLQELVLPDPLEQFSLWFDEAVNSKIDDANAMVLSTSNQHNQASSRVVLLKGYDKNGFVLYTNYQSRKAKELEINPAASLLFYWKELFRQVTIEGKVIKISKSESEKYFQSRPFESRIGALVSKQSSKVPDRKYLEDAFKKYIEEYKDSKKIPMPSEWGGYCLKPVRMEFWQGRESRLHDRILYEFNTNKGIWETSRLAP